MEAEINDEKVLTKPIETILDIISNTKTINKKEWIIMVKSLLEKLIKLGLKDLPMQIKIRRETKDSEQDFQ